MNRRRKRIAPIHPGAILLEEFLRPFGMTLGERAVTADTALWLARYFGTAERFWLNLQTR